MEKNFVSTLMLSADTPEMLRASDVYRVMEDATQRGYATQFKTWLLSKELRESTRIKVEQWAC